MAKQRTPKAAASEAIPRWQLRVDYVEACNCAFGCPCNFTGYPTNGFCEALVGYHVRDGRFGRTKLDGLDVIYAAAWPRAIHQGGGRLRLYVSDHATPEQRDALVRIFSGRAKGSGPFELFAGTMATIVRVNMPKGFIFKSAQAARTLVMKLFGAGSLSFDHSGQNAFYARLEFAGP